METPIKNLKYFLKENSMNFIQKFLRSIYYFFRRKPLTESQVSDIISTRIRKGGGIVGENVDILSSTIDLGEPYLISIGNNVTLTSMRLLTHDASTKKELGYTKVGRVTIGNEVFVGAGCIILPDTRIGNKVIIGAGSVVANDIPDNSVACGSPCRVICSYDHYMNKMKQKMEKTIRLDYFPDELLDDNNKSQKEELSKIGFGFIK